MKSGFFDNTEVISEDFATFVRGIITNGVTGETEDVLKVTAAGGMIISVAEGYCWINGHFGKVETPEILTVDMASGTYGRIDRIVARLDMLETKVYLAVLKGTESESPIAPELTRDGTYHELCLAEISISAGLTTIADSNITDTRADRELCGAILANTKELLALDGKADKLAYEATAEQVEKNRIAISVLEGKKRVIRELLDMPKELSLDYTAGRSLTIDGEFVNCEILKIEYEFAIGAESYEKTTADQGEITLLGVGDKNTTVAVSGSDYTRFANLSVELNEQSLVISASISGSNIIGLEGLVTISSVRGVYVE